MSDNSPVTVQQIEEKHPKCTDNNLEPEQFRKVFIGGINFRTNEDILRSHFAKYGEIIDCVVMRDARSRRTRGFGFVAFRTSSSVDDVQNNRPHVIDGKEVETKRAMPREDADKPDSHVTTKKLFVGGVKNPELTEEMLKDYFGTFGEMESLDVIIDNNTGDRRGFAFVKFYDYDSVDKAAQMKTHLIGGFRLETTKALSKQERQFANDKMRNQYMYNRGSGYRQRGYGDGGRYDNSDYRGGYSKYSRSDRDYYRDGRQRYMPYGGGPPPHSYQQHMGNYYMDYDPYGYYQHQQYRERWDDQAPAYNRPWSEQQRPMSQYPYPRDSGYPPWQYPTNSSLNSDIPNSSNDGESKFQMGTRHYEHSRPPNCVSQPSIISYGDSVKSYMHHQPPGAASTHPSDTSSGQPLQPNYEGRYSNPSYRPY